MWVMSFLLWPSADVIRSSAGFVGYSKNTTKKVVFLTLSAATQFLNSKLIIFTVVINVAVGEEEELYKLKRAFSEKYWRTWRKSITVGRGGRNKGVIKSFVFCLFSCLPPLTWFFPTTFLPFFLLKYFAKSFCFFFVLRWINFWENCRLYETVNVAGKSTLEFIAESIATFAV